MVSRPGVKLTQEERKDEKSGELQRGIQEECCGESGARDVFILRLRCLRARLRREDTRGIGDWVVGCPIGL